MSWTIDKVFQEMASDHIGIMDKYSPYIDEEEENKVHDTMDREKEDEEVIRYRLQVTIQRVEGM